MPRQLAAGIGIFRVLHLYLSRVLLSPYQPVAFIFISLAMIGSWAMFSESQKIWIIFHSFPVLYLMYFSLQRVMFVRNLLILTPFLVILSVKGFGYIHEKLPLKSHKLGISILASGLVVLNGFWCLYAAQTIQDNGVDTQAQNLAKEIESNPQKTYFVSESVWVALDSQNMTSFDNLTRVDTNSVDSVVFYFYADMEEPGYWPVNKPGIAPRSLGSLEVNLDYYSGWRGPDRILMAPPEVVSEIRYINLFEQN